MGPPLSRRRALGLAGGALGAVGATALGAAWAGSDERSAGATSASAGAAAAGTAVAFRGPHQAGVAEPLRAHVAVVGLDLRVPDGAALRSLLAGWTMAAERLVSGQQVGERSPSSRLPPVDTGEADDRPLSRLTITVGLGTPAFEPGRAAALGLPPRPAGLVAPPALPGDMLDPRYPPTELALVVAGDDEQVVHHAVRNLVRAADGAVHPVWSQPGYGPSPLGPSGDDVVARNQFGFREGTGNPPVGSPELEGAVWVAPGDDPGWMVGGTYLLLRRHRLDLAAWDQLHLLDRERVVGRHRRSGAPLGEIEEHAPLDLDAEGPDGLPVTDPRSHVAVARRATAARPMLRRPYNAIEVAGGGAGVDVGGQVFLAFARDLGAQVVPVVAALAEQDLLATYVRTTASCAYAVLPGVEGDGTWADHLPG